MHRLARPFDVIETSFRGDRIHAIRGVADAGARIAVERNRTRRCAWLDARRRLLRRFWRSMLVSIARTYRGSNAGPSARVWTCWRRSRKRAAASSPSFFGNRQRAKGNRNRSQADRNRERSGRLVRPSDRQGASRSDYLGGATRPRAMARVRESTTSQCSTTLPFSMR
jgi:hypothetical protein